MVIILLKFSGETRINYRRIIVKRERGLGYTNGGGDYASFI